MARSRVRREEMRRLIAEQESSGQSAARFAREQGMSPWSFYKWKRRLRADERPVQGAFVEVKVTGGQATQACGSPIGIELGNGVRLEVAEGFEPEHLRRLIAVLRSC